MARVDDIVVGHELGSYEISVGSGVVSQLSRVRARFTGFRPVVVYGSGVPAHHIDRIIASLAIDGVDAEIDRIAIDDGEAAKTLGVVDDLTGALVDRGFDRRTIAFVAGGGTAGDAGGLAVSLFMRGIPFVHVATTLLSQVDSSIGGKLGVNHSSGKNMIGLFRAPEAVISDSEFLETLTDRDWRSGLYEIIKAAIIADRELFEILEESSSLDELRNSDRLEEIIRRAIAVKAEIVSADERESDRRRLLNLGHTIGHGIEAGSDYAITHGDSVAWGVVAALEISRARDLVSSETAQRIESLLHRYGPEKPTGLDRERVLALVEHDKKFTRGDRWMVLPAEIGRCEIASVSREEIELGFDAAADCMFPG